MAISYFGASINIDGTNRRWHTWTNWGAIITNGDPVGDPELETNYINVPGRSGLLDFSESLTGEPVYKGRPINMEMQLKCNPEDWTSTVSNIRNLIDGRKVKITFDDDTDHYWLGRISVKDTDRVKRLGKFKLYAYCDAYKYDRASSQSDSTWERYIGTLNITDEYTLVIQAGNMATVPTITVSNITSETLTVKNVTKNKTYTLINGKNRFPDLKVCGDSNVTLKFTGSARVVVDYRGGSL